VSHHQHATLAIGNNHERSDQRCCEHEAIDALEDQEARSGGGCGVVLRHERPREDRHAECKGHRLEGGTAPDRERSGQDEKGKSDYPSRAGNLKPSQCRRHEQHDCDARRERHDLAHEEHGDFRTVERVDGSEDRRSLPDVQEIRVTFDRTLDRAVRQSMPVQQVLRVDVRNRLVVHEEVEEVCRNEDERERCSQRDPPRRGIARGYTDHLYGLSPEN
jgi:hypothetical protein